MRNITKAIGLVGIFIIIVSTIRWFFLYPDMSQFLLATSIGVVFVGFAYIHNSLSNLEKDLGDLGRSVDVQWKSLREVRKKVGIDE